MKETNNWDELCRKHMLTEKEAAAYIAMSREFLERSRSTTRKSRYLPGPSYVKLGRTIRYLRSDLDIWIKHHHKAIKPLATETAKDIVQEMLARRQGGDY